MRGQAELQRVSGEVPLHLLARGLAPRTEALVLLETLGGPGPKLLAWDPALWFRAEGGTLQTNDPKGLLPAGPTSLARGAPAALEQVLRRYPVPSVRWGEGTLPFVGGLAGFLGYEWAAAQEGPRREGPPGVPDLWMGLFDRALIDTSAGERWLVTLPSISGTRASEVALTLPGKAGTDTSAQGVCKARPRIESDLSRSGFEGHVREVRRRIRQGEVYQVNLARRLRARELDPWDLYGRLREVNPSPFGGVLAIRDLTIVSGSPELLLRAAPPSAEERWAATRPIAGTRPRGPAPQDARNERALRRSVKEVAEHTMLVDLARNDLGRVSRAGSVEVDEWLTVERYSHVMHLVSNVRGLLSPSASQPDLLRAMMPGASITGTPKIRATEVIAETEPVPRGAYTGSLGFLSLDGAMRWNLLIRSAIFPHGGTEAHLYAGAGIVQDSRPEREWQEVRRKAEALLRAAGGPSRAAYPWVPPRLYGSWSPPRPGRRFSDRRVLIIDNYDSFTYNLAQYLGALGAETTVVRNDVSTVAHLRRRRPTHVVLSPGPGSPGAAGVTVEAVLGFEGTPLLGVCLGHQAIVEAYGGKVGPAARPLHGKVTAIRRRKTGLPDDILEGLPVSFVGARYHSLVAQRVPPELEVTARSPSGEAMALQHRELPTYGVQFHPESMRTPQGMDVLARFLSLTGKGARVGRPRKGVLGVSTRRGRARDGGG